MHMACQCTWESHHTFLNRERKRGEIEREGERERERFVGAYEGSASTNIYQMSPYRSYLIWHTTKLYFKVPVLLSTRTLLIKHKCSWRRVVGSLHHNTLNHLILFTGHETLSPWGVGFSIWTIFRWYSNKVQVHKSHWLAHLLGLRLIL